MLDIVYISQSKQYSYRVQLKQGPSLTLYSKFEIQKYRTSRIWASTFTLSSLHHWRTTDSSAFLMTHKKQISRLRVDSVERGLFLLWKIQQSNQFKLLQLITFSDMVYMEVFNMIDFYCIVDWWIQMTLQFYEIYTFLINLSHLMTICLKPLIQKFPCL